MRRRRKASRLFALLPWLLALGVVMGVFGLLARVSATTTDALVARAASLRVGDLESRRERDPRGSLEILRSVLEDDPDHYAALVESARAYADLTNFDLAVARLEHAAETAETPGQAIGALRMAGNFLTRAGRYDEAVDKAARVVELQPQALQHRLHLGMAQYKGSVATQSTLRRRFVGVDKGDAELEIESRIESFVSDLWSDPDPDELLDWLAPDIDSAQRLEIRDELLSARRRFLEASDTLETFSEFDGFDAALSQGTCEVLLRSGRVFDAHIEASIALRHPKLPDTVERVFLEVLARCEALIGEHALAANRYEQICEVFVEQQGWTPPRFVDSTIEERVRAQDWALLLERLPQYEAWSRETTLIDWAEAEALAHTERRDEAREAIRDPFNTAGLSSFLPGSLRSFPWRRRAILMLAYELFAEDEDSRSLTALDTLVGGFPDDREVRRARIDEFLKMGLLEAALDDAFALLKPWSRNLDDFTLWMDIADRISQEHYGLSLAERAEAIVAEESEAWEAFLDADFTRANVGRRSNGDPSSPSQAPAMGKNPALAMAVIRARVTRDLEQARIDSRRLSEAFPQVQMFRFALARLLVREGKLESAVTEFRDLLAQVPNDSESLDLAMRIERALGRRDEAAELLNRMVLADPRGVGAVSYAKRLLSRGQAKQVLKLNQTVKRADNLELGFDHFLVIARAYLALGDIEAANSVLTPLATVYTHSPEVAMLALEIGLDSGTRGLVDAAAVHLTPLAGGLFPDQLGQLTTLLLANDEHELLLSLFDEDTRSLPAMVPALRPLAEAAKALGRVDEAVELLRMLNDDASLRDSFLLLALDGQVDVASRRLRLEESQFERRSEVALCELAGQALRNHRALLDGTPVERLRALTDDLEMTPAELETIDAMLRLLPVLDHPEDVLPKTVTTAPLEAYPHAGNDLILWMKLAGQDLDRGRETGRSLLLLMLAHDRPFWRREARFLAEHVLREIPDHRMASQIYARLALKDGEAENALRVLLPLTYTPDAPVEVLALAMQAAREANKDAWGMALAAAHAERRDVRLLISGALVERGQALAALDRLRELYNEDPTDDDALAATLGVLGALRRQVELVPLLHRALERQPLPGALKRACLDALANILQLDDEAMAIADVLAAANPEETPLLIAIARSAKDDPERVGELLDQVLANIEAHRNDDIDSEADIRELGIMLLHSARIARTHGLNDRARHLYELMLRIDPGGIEHYRDIASLEIEEGNLSLARRFLEVLVFVDKRDKEPPLMLSRLLFEQVGQPHEAAKVVAEIFKHNMPPAAAEILAADFYMRGDLESAVRAFKKVATSPLVDENTYLTVGRIAFAGGDDLAAAQVFDLFLRTADPEHPDYKRVEALRALCTLPEASAEVAAEG